MKRPKLTLAAIAGLQAVAADARAMVDERQGSCDHSMDRHDKLVHRGLRFIEDLLKWSAHQSFRKH